MSQTIYWHDYETFGANPSVDRPSQFAGIRTTLDLDIVGEPLMVYCQPIPDQLPSPDACLMTGISPQYAQQHGIPEPEFIARIHAEFAQPQTCVAGYNSLRFDDEVTRYTLYRNFYDPYAREWQNGNSRWDIIDMVRLVYALRPELLNWPEPEPGVPSFKLELLSQHNGLEHESAHDALSDVLATIKLAEKIKQQEPRLYEYCWGLRNKHAVAAKINLKNKKPLLHISSKIPASRSCSTIVMPLCAHPGNKNAVICIDLCLAVDPLFELSSEQLKERLYTASDQLAEGEQRVPLKAIHFNRCPIVLPVQMLDADNARRLGIDIQQAENRWQQLLSQEQLIEKVQFAFSSDFDVISDAESALYQGFLPDSDRRLAEQVLQASVEQLRQHNFVFQDERMNELLFRYKARHYPQSLNKQEYTLWLQQVREVYISPVSGVSILDAYESQLAERINQAPEKDLQILGDLQDWAKQFRSTFGD